MLWFNNSNSNIMNQWFCHQSKTWHVKWIKTQKKYHITSPKSQIAACLFPGSPRSSGSSLQLLIPTSKSVPKQEVKGCIWMFPNIGFFSPKMDGENNGKPLLKWDDLGGPPLFSETPNIELFSSFANKKPTAFEILVWSDHQAVRSKPKFELDKKNSGHKKLTNHL